MEHPFESPSVRRAVVPKSPCERGDIDHETFRDQLGGASRCPRISQQFDTGLDSGDQLALVDRPPSWLGFAWGDDLGTWIGHLSGHDERPSTVGTFDHERGDSAARTIVDMTPVLLALIAIVLPLARLLAPLLVKGAPVELPELVTAAPPSQLGQEEA